MASRISEMAKTTSRRNGLAASAKRYSTSMSAVSGRLEMNSPHAVPRVPRQRQVARARCEPSDGKRPAEKIS